MTLKFAKIQNKKQIEKEIKRRRRAFKFIQTFSYNKKKRKL